MNGVKAPGRNFLLVTGIITVVWLAVDLILLLSAQAALGPFAARLSDLDWLIIVVHTGYTIIVGILAIVWRDETGPASRARLLPGMGAWVIAGAVARGIVVQFGVAGFGFDILMGLLGGALTLPYMIPFLIGAKKNVDFVERLQSSIIKCVSCSRDIDSFYAKTCRHCLTDNTPAGVEKFRLNKAIESAQQSQQVQQSKRMELLTAIEVCKANIQAANNNPSNTPGLDEARIKANVEEIARLELELSRQP